MNVLYFASVRQRIGRGEENIEYTANLRTVADLIASLRVRGGGYREVFSDIARVRVAVNQVHAQIDTVLSAGDEIAFFPPVTGG